MVYDVTRPGTFEAVKKWKADLDENLSASERPLPVVLLANKCDLSETRLDPAKMDAYIKENRFIAWYETSAKEDIGITKGVKTLVAHILENDPDVIHEKERAQGFKLGAEEQKDDSKAKKSDGCC